MNNYLIDGKIDYWITARVFISVIGRRQLLTGIGTKATRLPLSGIDRLQLLAVSRLGRVTLSFPFLNSFALLSSRFTASGNCIA